MKTRLLAGVVALFLLCAPAFALKRMQKVTPNWGKDAGITVETNKRDDDTIGFTVTRSLDKARSFPADSELTINRTAHLTVRNHGGTLATTIVAGKETKETVVYWFALSKDCIPYSSFTLDEYDDYKDEKREHLIGGGDIFEFALAEFAAAFLKPKLPLHP